MTEEKWVNEETDQDKNKAEKLLASRREKLSTTDWMSMQDIKDVEVFDIYEVSFKDGARKEFCRNANNLNLTTGDWVVVNTGNGYDTGRISLSGDLVRLQMKKRKVAPDAELNEIMRPATDWDMKKLEDARAMEYESMLKARRIAASLDLDMKIGDVEYQGDKRKATFYYTSDGRVDFRELVKIYAKEFKVKIEMRQIGIRQESSRIGGLGSCGRELCCSSWHTNFTSVTTNMVRYQNLSVNQTKLTGVCGRLKCCLNFELDTYLEALEDFPKNAEVLQLKYMDAHLVKFDIFKGVIYYSIKHENDRVKIYTLSKEKVNEILEMNTRGEKPLDFGIMEYMNEDTGGDDFDFEDVTGQIELPERRRKRKAKPSKKSTKTGNEKKSYGGKNIKRKSGNAKAKHRDNKNYRRGNARKNSNKNKNRRR